MATLKFIEANIKDIKPYDKNPRIIPQEAVDKVANSIKEFGMKNPILVDKDMVIIAGHTRLKACEALGIGTIPCNIALDLTPEQVKALRLADNKTAEFSSWDFSLLDFELGELFEDGFDMAPFGFEDGAFDGIGALGDDDETGGADVAPNEFAITFVFPLEKKDRYMAIMNKRGEKDKVRAQIEAILDGWEVAE